VDWPILFVRNTTDIPDEFIINKTIKYISEYIKISQIYVGESIIGEIREIRIPMMSFRKIARDITAVGTTVTRVPAFTTWLKQNRSFLCQTVKLPNETKVRHVAFARGFPENKPLDLGKQSDSIPVNIKRTMTDRYFLQTFTVQ